MIEIVKHGKRYQMTCKYCGCIFRYSLKDENWTGYSFDSHYVYCPDCGKNNEIVDPLEVKPIVDEMLAVEVGEWIEVNPFQANDGGAYMCSKCRTGDWGYKRFKYCPNCGVPMTNSKD